MINSQEWEPVYVFFLFSRQDFCSFLRLFCVLSACKIGKPCKNYFSSYKLAPECRFYTQKCRKNMKNCPKLLQKVAKK